MIFLALWALSYILGVILTEGSIAEHEGYLYRAVSRSLLWPIIIVIHFQFVRKYEKADFDNVWLLSLYASFTFWIIFSAVGIKSIAMILAIPILFLSAQFLRLSKPSYGRILKHIKSSYLGSISFSFSLVILVCSLSLFFSSEAASVLLLFLLLVPAIILTHFKADLLSGGVFAWFSFAVGFVNLELSSYITVAGFSLGAIFLLLVSFSVFIVKEDPSRKVFATVNPTEPIDEAELRIELDQEETRSKSRP
ncbi:hypothetical protein [Mesotoga prima]|uniref:hypothetical protein n=1 Tax=Mesotoga prima TaxID=1184387 RepID=UPI002D02DECA|nr:hypothetical protein [Mesotoga prima]HOP37213.1 hypothetical protein [Mesotoga prima]